MAENLYQIDSIQKKIAVLEMVEKLKSCGLTWTQQDSLVWKSFYNDGGNFWEMILTKQSGSVSNGEKSLTIDYVVLDFKKNDNHFYTISSEDDENILEMWMEIVGDVEHLKEERLLRDIQTLRPFRETSTTRHVPLGGIRLGGPGDFSNYSIVPDSYGVSASRTSATIEHILPIYLFDGPRKISVWGDKIYVACESDPVCTVDENGDYFVGGVGRLNVIDKFLKNKQVINYTNRIISLPITAAHIAVSKQNIPRPGSTYARSKIYASGLYGRSVNVIDVDKQSFDKFIFTDYQTTGMFLNQSLNNLYVAQTKMDINNQVWRFDLPFGPPYPPDQQPVLVPVIPNTMPVGPPYRADDSLQEYPYPPVGVQNTPGQSYVTIINTLTDEILTVIDLGVASLNDITVDFDTNFVYLADASEDQIIVLDPTQQYSVIKKIKVGLLPVGLEIFRKNLYVVNNESQTITVIDIGNGNFEVMSNISLPNRPLRIKINPKTNLGYVTIFGAYDSYDSRVAIIDLKSKKVLGYYTVGFGPCDLDLDLDSETMYVSCYLSNFVSTINLKDTFAPLS